MRAVLAALAFALAALAQLACAQAPIPPLTGPVVDTTGTLKPEQVSGLAAELRAFHERKGAQVQVLMVPTTRPEAIEQYSIRVAEAWKIGRKGTDDGVILVVAKDDREVRIEVGYGLEGAIPDATAHRIIDEQIVPHFKAGDFHAGIRSGAAAIMTRIDGEPLPEPMRRTPQGGGHLDWIIWVLFAVLVFGGMLRAIFGRFLTAVIGGGAIGAVATFIMGSLVVGVVAGLFGFMFMLATGGGRGRYIGGPIGGGWGGGGFGGGGGSWGGGGGGFGGGGASGRW